jgi:hypothetical protein
MRIDYMHRGREFVELISQRVDGAAGCVASSVPVL